MSKKKKMIPKFRFPEFVKNEEWKEKELDETLDYIQPTKYLVESTIYNDSHKTPVLTPGKTFILGYTDETKGIYKKNLPVIIFDDFTTVSKYVDFPFKVKSSAIKILTAKKDTNIKFVFEAMQMIDFHIGVHKRNWISIFSKLKIPIPHFDEQQKIASCLSSLDEVIAAHGQKLDLLKDHKKGLMQNLFPQEGEKVPKYRFKEFGKDGNWIIKKLDDIATILKGKGIPKADIVENGNLPCIRYGELYTHYNERISIIKSYTNLVADDLVLSKANDVVIPSSGETQIDIATASCVLESGIALGSDLNIIRSKINGVFLSYYLNNAKKKEIAQMAQGIAVVHLYPSQLKTLQIQFPKPQEQQKIASCLSSLDEAITAQAEKIEELKQHKKGLMQGLFPKIID